MSIKKTLLYHLADKLEKVCFLTHWLNPITAWLFNRHCLPVSWSYALDDKYNLGIWKYECQVCGSFDTTTVIKTEVFKYKDKKVEVDNYESLKCYNCNQSIATKESNKRAEPLIKAMHEEE